MNTPMTRQRATALVFFLCFSAFAASAAVAAETGFYVGAYYGQTSRDGETPFFDRYRAAINDDVLFTPFETSSRRDNEDSAFGFQAGYRLTQHVAFEGGYMDLGTIKDRAASPGAFPDRLATFSVNVDSETSGIALSALGILPLGRTIELYARGGVMFSTNKVKAFVTDGERVGRDEFSETSTDLLAGVGASLAFFEIYGLRLEFQRVFEAGNEDAGGGEDLDLVSLGITVAF